MSRPGIVDRTPELEDAIIERIAGGENLREISRGEGVPPESTIRSWAREDPAGFGERLRQAREQSAEHWDAQAEAVLREAQPTREEISRARELSQVYRWRARVYAPRVYGEKLDVNVSGTVAIAEQLAEVRQRRLLIEGTAVPAPRRAAGAERNHGGRSMIFDASLTMSNAQDLTGAAALTASTNTLDLSSRINVDDAALPVWAFFTIPPTSGTGGATLNIAVQTSADNATWNTIVETGAQPITSVTAASPFGFRGRLPFGVKRYLRMAYTPSAALTAGTVTAQVGSDYPVVGLYPKNFA